MRNSRKLLTDQLANVEHQFYALSEAVEDIYALLHQSFTMVHINDADTAYCLLDCGHTVTMPAGLSVTQYRPGALIACPDAHGLTTVVAMGVGANVEPA
jgi:hypothetical protein